MQRIKILKREPKPEDPEASVSSNPLPSIEEREEQYMQAKARIFNPTPNTASSQATERPERPPQRAEYRFKEDDITDPE